jgi:DNA-binding NarL/FixJ family response regulator
MPQMSISLAIVEDLAEVREGLKQFISLNPEFTILGTFQTAEEALHKLPQAKPRYCDHGHQSPRHEWDRVHQAYKEKNSAHAIHDVYGI